MKLHLSILLTAIVVAPCAALAAELSITDCMGLPRFTTSLSNNSDTPVSAKLSFQGDNAVASSNWRFTLIDAKSDSSKEIVAKGLSAQIDDLSSGVWRVCTPDGITFSKASLVTDGSNLRTYAAVGGIAGGATALALVFSGSDSGDSPAGAAVDLGDNPGAGSVDLGDPVSTGPSQTVSVKSPSVSPRPPSGNPDTGISAGDCAVDEEPTPLSPIS